MVDLDELREKLKEVTIMGKLFHETQFQRGEHHLTQYGFQREDGFPKAENARVRPSFVCSNIPELAKILADYKLTVNHFDSWGEPTLMATDSLNAVPTVAIRTSIGVDAPVSLVELAKLYSKHLTENAYS